MKRKSQQTKLIKLSLGDYIRVKVASNGYYGLTNSLCKITDKKPHNGLIFDSPATFNVEVVEHDDKNIIGSVWRVDISGTFELVDYNKTKATFKELQVIVKGDETKVVNGHNIGIATKSQVDENNEMFGVLIATMRSYNASDELIQSVIDALFKDSSNMLSKIGTLDLINELKKRVK